MTESKWITLGNIIGLVVMPGRQSGQRLADAAKGLQAEPDFAADAEFIERELFVPDNHEV